MDLQDVEDNQSTVKSKVVKKRGATLTPAASKQPSNETTKDTIIQPM